MSSSGIYLNDEDIVAVSETCKFFATSAEKKKVMDALCTINLAKKYLKNYNVDVDTTSLCCIEDFIQTYGITDIYINGFFVNVIAVEKDTDLLVPMLHFNKNTAPLAYLFVETDEEQNSCEPLGFVLKDDIDTTTVQDAYYAVDKTSLKDFSEIEYIFAGHAEEELSDDFDKQVFNYLDNKLTGTNDFLYTLLNSKNAREFLLKAYKAKVIFDYVSTPEKIIDNGGNEDLVENDFSSDTQELETITAMAQEEPDEQTFDMDTPNINNFNIEEISNTENFDTEDSVYDIISEQNQTDDGTDNSEQIIDYSSNDAIIDNTQEETVNTYNTGTTPSLEDIEKELSVENNVSPQYEEISNNDSIDKLYNGQQNNAVYGAQFVPPKKKSNFIPTLLVLSLIAGGGYIGYTKFFQQADISLNNEAPIEEADTIDLDKGKETSPDAMPIETVEDTQAQSSTEEAVAVSIPAIENNIDASILVENLSVNWQVPSGYVSNSAAKRYFTRIGKIIQLNLKTEMLLLSKPPISDKIVLELEYNKSSQNFEIKEITTSSGEKTIDDLVMHVVKKTLKSGKYADMSIFKNIPGNPSLVVRL